MSVRQHQDVLLFALSVVIERVYARNCLPHNECVQARGGGQACAYKRVFGDVSGCSSGEDSLLVGLSVYEFSAALRCTDVILSRLLT